MVDYVLAAPRTCQSGEIANLDTAADVEQFLDGKRSKPLGRLKTSASEVQVRFLAESQKYPPARAIPAE
jgi:hypothetical protein